MAHSELDLPIPRAASPADVMRMASQALADGACVVVATVLQTHGSAPGTPGQKLLLTSGRECAGTVGGGALERRVLEEMTGTLAILQRGGLETHERLPAPRSLSLRLGPELGMCCGGGVDVLLEPMLPSTRVVIVGAGHVATALVPMLDALGCSVIVVDEREGWADPARLPRADVRGGSHRAVKVDAPHRAVALVMTHDHALDQEGIEWALREGFGFVGGVGSRAKASRTRARLEAKGFSPVDIQRVRMPLGVAIGARTPAEIAVSICGDVIAWIRAFDADALAARKPHAKASESASKSAPASVARTPAAKHRDD